MGFYMVFEGWTLESPVGLPVGYTWEFLFLGLPVGYTWEFLFLEKIILAFFKNPLFFPPPLVLRLVLTRDFLLDFPLRLPPNLLFDFRLYVFFTRVIYIITKDKKNFNDIVNRL